MCDHIIFRVFVADSHPSSASEPDPESFNSVGSRKYGRACEPEELVLVRMT